MPSKFSDWELWENAPAFTEASLKETLLGGQAFRWVQKEDFFEGRWATQVVRLRLVEEALYLASCESDARAALDQYFARATDFAGMTDALPWRSDPIMKTAVEAFNGLRILRQPLGETLFCFLCSSTKQIPQIKAICEAVASDMGPKLSDGSHALPDWLTIADAGEARLRTAKLGYRARYIHATACFLAEHPEWLMQIESAPTEQARERLLELPGVGRKIADCVLLFGAGRMDAFPIDTWVEKILTRAYGLEGWNLPQLQTFARTHFGPNAGYAQQYLFAAARAGYIPA